MRKSSVSRIRNRNRPTFEHSCHHVGRAGARRQPTTSNLRSSFVVRSKARRAGPISPPLRRCSAGTGMETRSAGCCPFANWTSGMDAPPESSGRRTILETGSSISNELLDRRQLLNQDVRVIRYKQSATQGRNLIISSRAPLGLLRSMVVHRLRVLGLDLSPDDLRRFADDLINDANDVSGDIVLRAAKRGQNASELIGVVLSRHLVGQELGRDRHCGWYFLDDYAAWDGATRRATRRYSRYQPPGNRGRRSSSESGRYGGQVYRARKPRRKAEGVAEATPRHGSPAERRHIRGY